MIVKFSGSRGEEIREERKVNLCAGREGYFGEGASLNELKMGAREAEASPLKWVPANREIWAERAHLTLYFAEVPIS